MGMSKVELANQALDHLGKDRIADLAENSVAARKVNEVIDRVIRSALQRAPWTFASKFAVLAEVTNDWDARWEHKYDIPNDCLKVVRLVPEVDIYGAPPVSYDLRGSALYANEDPATLEYVFDMTDTSTMPTTFLDAVAILLARDIAMPLTRKGTYFDELNRLYEYQIAKASEIDAGQSRSSYVQANEYLRARGDGGFDIAMDNADGSHYWR